MDAADLSAASRRVGRSRGERECLSEQGGCAAGPRESHGSTTPPVVCRKGAPSGPDLKSTPSKCRGDSERDPRGCGAPFARPAVPTLSGCRKSQPTPASLIPPFCIISAAARAWSKRWSSRGIAGLQAQSLEGWPSAKEPDIEGVLERFYEVASQRGMARMLAWLILTGESHRTMKPGLLKPAAERMHAGRVPDERRRKDAARRNRWKSRCSPRPELFILVLGDSLFGPSVRRAMGLGSSADSTRRFRRWLSKVLERMESRRPPRASCSES